MPKSLILILDDELSLVRRTQRILENAGFQTLTADLPQQALNILDLYPVDALLINMRIPGLDGSHFLNEARCHRPDLTIVVMTGFGSLDAAVTATRRGADGMVLTPFHENELIESVSLALENTAYRRDAIRLRALQPIFKMVETMYSVTDPIVLRTLAVENVHQLFQSSFTVLYMMDETSTFRQAASLGPVVDLKACIDTIDWKESYMDSVSKWGSRDASQNPHILATLQCYNLVDILCAGAASKQGDSGVLLLMARGAGQLPFTQADHDAFVILARQAALAMENAGLCDNLRHSMQELERSQQAIMQIDKMATIGRLTATIAHEINNPLQGLQNWLQLADRYDLPSEDRKRYLALGQKELNRLRLTVQRMLDFYRPGLRDKRLVDLNDLVRYVISLLEPQLSESHVSVHLALDEDLPAVMAVSSQIQQVLLNLLINAIQAMPMGGKVSVKTAKISLQPVGKLGRPAVEIIVADTGLGVTQSVRERLFEPFLSTKDHGTGLGLPLCYGIITAHGGSLELMPENGAGARFRIVLPEDEG